jgi:hypothetical protein
MNWLVLASAAWFLLGAYFSTKELNLRTKMGGYEEFKGILWVPQMFLGPFAYLVYKRTLREYNSES